MIIAISTETEIITQPFKKIPRIQQISPIEGCVIIYSHPLIGFNWEFQQDNQHLDALWYDYYRVNQLLVDCLNSDCYVISREVRQEIEDTLLLPIAEVEQRKAKSV